ncbi:unnamed protein product [Caretta caretta]
MDSDLPGGVLDDLAAPIDYANRKRLRGCEGINENYDLAKQLINHCNCLPVNVQLHLDGNTSSPVKMVHA